MPDGVDRCPQGGQGAESDEEKIVAATFAALSFRNESTSAFVTLPPGMRALQLSTWPGLTLLKGREFRAPTRPEALFGIRFKLERPSIVKGKATVRVEESGGWYFSFSEAKLERIGGRWYGMEFQSKGTAVA